MLGEIFWLRETSTLRCKLMYNDWRPLKCVWFSRFQCCLNTEKHCSSVFGLAHVRNYITRIGMFHFNLRYWPCLAPPPPSVEHDRVMTSPSTGDYSWGTIFLVASSVFLEWDFLLWAQWSAAGQHVCSLRLSLQISIDKVWWRFSVCFCLTSLCSGHHGYHCKLCLYSLGWSEGKKCWYKK